MLGKTIVEANGILQGNRSETKRHETQTQKEVEE